MRLHSLGAHEQRARDLPVGAPGCNQFSDPGFRRGDAAHADGYAGRSPIRPSSALVAWAHSGAGLGRWLLGAVRGRGDLAASGGWLITARLVGFLEFAMIFEVVVRLSGHRSGRPAATPSRPY